MSLGAIQINERMFPVKEWMNTAKAKLYRIPIPLRRSFYNILFVLVLLPFFAFHAEGCVTSAVFKLSAEDQRLGSSLIYETEVYSLMDCAHLCLSEHPRCKAITFEKSGKQYYKRKKCQLNNETKTTKPDELVPDNAYNYFEPIEICSELRTQKLQQMLNQDNVKQEISCADMYKKGVRADGIYTIDPDGLGPFKVRCDMTRNGGGWTVFQRRMDGSVDFYLGWGDYKKGFGDLNGEFWLGLDEINRLSKSGQNVLRIDLESFDNEKRYAQYSTFAVANEVDSYKLTVGRYSGNAGDSLTAWHNGMTFSTKDAGYQSRCAITYIGAWWYRACFHSHLNGQYKYGSAAAYGQGVLWYHWENRWYYSLKNTEMKIRPASF